MPDVPLEPPDSIPHDVQRNLDPTLDVPRDIVTVRFRKGTSVDQRRTAIGAISGIVIGGSAGSRSLEGTYLIRIPDTGNMDGLNAAIITLKEYDFVVLAEYYLTLGHNPRSTA